MGRQLHIPYTRQWIDDDDIQAVCDVLRSDFLTCGPKVDAFEEALCALTGAKYAIALNSATAALHLACLASEVRAGDEVITSPISFVASASCAVFCGAIPIFADIDPQSYNIDPQEMARKINAKTRAVIPVHFAGQSAAMEQIHTVVEAKSREFGRKIYIIEDASHAIGSCYQGDPVGSCRYSDFVVFSFHPAKHITTGEGGALLSNHEAAYRASVLKRHHGLTKDPQDWSKIHQNESPFWFYEQNVLGYNYRISDIQCALGISQLQKLKRFKQRRRMIVDAYHRAFQACEGLTIHYESKECDSNFHLYVIQCAFEQKRVTREKMMRALQDKGIMTQVHYIPIHTQPYYQNHYQTQWGDYPCAETYYQRCLSLPLYPHMRDEDVSVVIDAVKTIWQGSHV